MSYSEPTSDLHRTDAAPGDQRLDRAEIAEGIKSYLVGLGLSILLTVMSFFISGTTLVWGPSIPVALVVLAIAQMGVHLVFFLHITTAPDNVNNVLALAFGVLIVLLVLAGSLWIMAHLNYNMKPMDQMMPMQLERGPGARAINAEELSAKKPGLVHASVILHGEKGPWAPWGHLTAIDLNTRNIAWRLPIGTSRENGPLGIPRRVPMPTGVPKMGGSVVTASGLVFIGATADGTFRAFDSASGKELWSDYLPDSGIATPMTYMGRDGRQYVVIAAGGHSGLTLTYGDAVVAYALPNVDGVN